MRGSTMSTVAPSWPGGFLAEDTGTGFVSVGPASIRSAGSAVRRPPPRGRFAARAEGADGRTSRLAVRADPARARPRRAAGRGRGRWGRPVVRALRAVPRPGPGGPGGRTGDLAEPGGPRGARGRVGPAARRLRTER